MAPPYTMKGRDEMEVPVVMNSPVPAIINGATNGVGDNLHGVEKMVVTHKKKVENEKKDVNLKVSEVINTKTENTKPITTFLEKDTNVSVDKKGIVVIKSQDFSSSPQEHLPALRQRVAKEEQRLATEKNESESILDLGRKVEVMELDILSTLEMVSSSTPRQSPHSTTLTPSLDAMHINSSEPVFPSAMVSQSQNSVVLAPGVQNMKIPITPTIFPTLPTQCTPEQKPAAVTANHQRMRNFSAKTSPKVPPQAEEMPIYLFSNLSLRQKRGKHLVNKSITEIERATEALTGSDNEEGFSDFDVENMLKLVEANRKLVKGCDMLGWEEGSFVEGVKEIEGMLGEWEDAYPDGEWVDVFCRLGNEDEDLVEEWKGMMEEFEEIENGGEKEAQAVEESDDEKQDEKDEGNESMEYIAPTEITAKGEKKQDSTVTSGEQSILETPSMAPPVITPTQSKPIDFISAPASTATKSWSPSPIQATLSSSQYMPVLLDSKHLPPKSKYFNFVPEISTSSLPHPWVPFQSSPPINDFAAMTTTAASPQHSTPLSIDNSDEKDVRTSFVFDQGPSSSSARPPYLPNFNYDLPNFSPTLSQISSPRFSPNLCYLSTTRPETKEKKTASTLFTLSQTTQCLQDSVESLHAAVYGLDPSTQTPQSARDAGLLLMNNYIGEWLTDLRIKISNLDTKVNEIGILLQNLLKSSDPKILRGIHETATLAQIAALSTESKVERNSEVLFEIKSLMKKLLAKTGENIEDKKEMEEGQKPPIRDLCHENRELRQKVEKLEKKKKSVGVEDVKLLRLEHAGLHSVVAGLNKKMDLLVEGQRNVVEMEEDSQGLMQLLWPQGGGTLNVGGTPRGVLADEPGYRRLDGDAEKEMLIGNQAGRGGGGGGGSCVVM